MFFHKQELQYTATPSEPDAVYARRMQEILGGQYGEITVAMQYSFQAWNAHMPGRYRDLPFGIAAEDTMAFLPPTQPDARYFGTTGTPNVIEKAADVVKDKVSKK